MDEQQTGNDMRTCVCVCACACTCSVAQLCLALCDLMTVVVVV